MGWGLTAAHVVMSEEDLALLNELLSSELGLVFAEAKREILESRLRPRLAALRLRSFRDYYLHLLYANGEGEAERGAERGHSDDQCWLLFRRGAVHAQHPCTRRHRSRSKH